MKRELKIKKKLMYYAEKIENQFNSFFTNVNPSLAEKIPPVSTNFTEYLIPFNESIRKFDLTTEEFETAFKSLKRSKAVGLEKN